MNRNARRRYLRNWVHLDRAQNDLVYWVKRFGPYDVQGARRLRDVIMRLERTKLTIEEVYQAQGYHFPAKPDQELGLTEYDAPLRRG